MGPISGLDTSKERISKLEDISIGRNLQNQKANKKKDWKKQNRIYNHKRDNYKRCNLCVMGILEEERKEQKKYLKQ